MPIYYRLFMIVISMLAYQAAFINILCVKSSQVESVYYEKTRSNHGQMGKHSRRLEDNTMVNEM